MTTLGVGLGALGLAAAVAAAVFGAAEISALFLDGVADRFSEATVAVFEAINDPAAAAAAVVVGACSEAAAAAATAAVLLAFFLAGVGGRLASGLAAAAAAAVNIGAAAAVGIGAAVFDDSPTEGFSDNLVSFESSKTAAAAGEISAGGAAVVAATTTPARSKDNLTGVPTPPLSPLSRCLLCGNWPDDDGVDVGAAVWVGAAVKVTGTREEITSGSAVKGSKAPTLAAAAEGRCPVR